jgi:hypothetical protein
MTPIRKNLFAICTKICYDSDRGIQQSVENRFKNRFSQPLTGTFRQRGFHILPVTQQAYRAAS